MPFERTKILNFNQYWKYDEKSWVIYADLETFIEKIDGCKNNVEKSSQQKQMNIFHTGFQCLRYVHSRVYKISMM